MVQEFELDLEEDPLSIEDDDFESEIDSLGLD